jgi:ribosome-associated toxin RatA of RatAB toxin-antitoxin module
MHTKIIASTIGLAFALTQLPPPASARGSTDVRAETVETASLPAEGLDIQWGQAATVIHLPAERVLAILHDYARYAELFPQFRASRVLASRGNEALVYIEARVAYDSFTLWGNLRISSKEQAGAHVIDARLKRGNVNHFHAVWNVRELEGGAACAVEFKLLVDPNMKLPSSVISSENVKAAKRALVALRKRAALTS